MLAILLNLLGMGTYTEEPETGPGGYNLYRGVGSTPADVDWGTVLAHVNPGHSTITHPAAGLAAHTEYVYALRATSDQGIEEPGTECITRVLWTGAALEGDLPAAVQAASVAAGPGGSARLRFVFAQNDRAVASGVQVAVVSGGVPDWVHLLATIPVDPAGMTAYDAAVVGWTWFDGDPIALAVRAVTAGGIPGPRMILPPVDADDQVPNQITSLVVTQEA